jgi:hypothetical protein
MTDRWGLTRGVVAGAALAVLTAAAFLPSQASARTHIGFGFNFGVPVYPPPPPIVYAPPPVYYVPPPPVYYVPPPPVVYTSPPAVYAPPPPASYAPPPAAPTAGQYCREYQSTTVIDGKPQPMYGTACLQPDGSWRIVN